MRKDSSESLTLSLIFSFSITRQGGLDVVSFFDSRSSLLRAAPVIAAALSSMVSHYVAVLVLERIAQ